jgi:glycosyltransferase involved in cell wall biosynthesis
MKPLISIIVPFYNSEKYIGKCIESILAQTLGDFEVLLINDGSKDESEAVCKKYADPRVRVITKENGGVSLARNLGLQEATGDFISFIDSDDWVESEFLEKLYAVMKPGVDFAMCGHISVANNNMTEIKTNIKFPVLDREKIISVIINSWGTKTNLKGLNVVCTKLYRRDFIADTRFDEKQRHGEDWWFNIRLYDKAQKIAVVEECLYYYSISNNATSLSKAFYMDYTDHLISSYNKVLPLVYKYGLSKSVFTTNYIRSIIRYISSALFKLHKDDFDILYKQLRGNEDFCIMVDSPNNLKKSELRLAKSVRQKPLMCFLIRYELFTDKVVKKFNSIFG